MAADVRTSLKDWSTTVGSNLPTGSTSISTNLDDNLCQIQSTVRYETASRDTIASASTCDLGTKDAGSLDITGTTTITSFGTVSAGIRKLVTFSGALTLTYNATSLKLPGSSNITTAAGDTALFESLGSGNWNCLYYQRKSSVFPASLTSGYFLTNNGTTLSWAVPAASLSSLTAATAANTIANGAYNQIWGWSGLGASDIGIEFNGTSSGNNGTVVRIKGSGSGSNNPAYLLTMQGAYSATMLTVSPLSFVFQPGTSTAGAGGAFTVIAGTGGASSAGGDVSISSGTGGSSGAGGALSLTAGDGTSAAGGSVVISSGAGSTNGSVQLYGTTGGVRLRIGGGAPTISSGGGAGATVRGSDNFFEVTAGTGSPSNVVVGFSAAKASAPMCVVSSSADAEMKYSASTTGVTITPASGTLTSGTKITCMVIEAT